MVERVSGFAERSRGGEAETEPRFRRGESAGKPLGGNIADTLFARTLYVLAKSHGYETQMSLSREFGENRNGLVSKWYSGKQFPDTEHFGALLRILKPNDEELDVLVEPWRAHLRETFISRSRAVRARAKENQHGPLRSFFNNLADSHALTLKEIFGLLLLADHNFSGEMSVALLSEILEKAPVVLDLMDEETAKLADAVAGEVAAKVARGKKGRRTFGSARLKKLQTSLVCKTYTPADAAGELDVTRERVRQLREDYDLPLLMTEGQLEILRNRPRRLKKSKAKK